MRIGVDNMAGLTGIWLSGLQQFHRSCQILCSTCQRLLLYLAQKHQLPEQRRLPRLLPRRSAPLRGPEHVLRGGTVLTAGKIAQETGQKQGQPSFRHRLHYLGKWWAIHDGRRWAPQSAPNVVVPLRQTCSLFQDWVPWCRCTSRRSCSRMSKWPCRDLQSIGQSCIRRRGGGRGKSRRRSMLSRLLSQISTDWMKILAKEIAFIKTNFIWL